MIDRRAFTRGLFIATAPAIVPVSGLMRVWPIKSRPLAAPMSPQVPAGFPMEPFPYLPFNPLEPDFRRDMLRYLQNCSLKPPYIDRAWTTSELVEATHFAIDESARRRGVELIQNPNQNIKKSNDV